MINLIGGCTNYSVNKIHNDYLHNNILNDIAGVKYELPETQQVPDSIVITCYDIDNSKYMEYLIIYSESNGLTIQAKDLEMGLIPLKIDFQNYTEEFLSVIDEFYITKRSCIIKKKNKLNDDWITDKPTFIIECYCENKKLLSEFTKLSVEGYELVFDEKYEDFIREIKNMIQKYDRKVYNTDALRQKYW